MNMIVLKVLFYFLRFLLRALILKNSHILAGIYFIILKKRPRQNLKGIHYKFGPR